MAEYATNPKAGFDYEILETIEAGCGLERGRDKINKTERDTKKEAIF